MVTGFMPTSAARSSRWRYGNGFLRAGIGTACAVLATAIVVAAAPARAQSDNTQGMGAKGVDAQGMDEIAAAVRVHGYACDHPQEFGPDPQISSPDEEGWIITCENGRYRVKFLGDTGSLVEPIE